MREPYDFSNLAKADLAQIYAFGLERWGEAQADRYFFQLFDQFSEIANDPTRYPIAHDFREGCRRKAFGSHAIYFKITPTTVIIIAVVGAQDFGSYL